MIRLRPSGADEVLIKRVRDWYEPGPGVFIAPQALFNPALLFTTGVNGTWYDPSDLNTLFQDAAGTTPVTAVEQPVGLMLDKSARGNHAFNSSGNSANFPVLSARYNLLTKTEDFSDAAWVKNGSTATSSSVTATAAFASAYQTVAVSPSAQYTQVAEVQFGSGATQIFSLLSESGTSYTASFNLQSGTVVAQSNCTATIAALGGGYYRLSATFTNAAGVTSLTPKYWIGLYNGANNSGTVFNIRNADFRATNDALNQPAYQRVTTGSDYDTVGFKPYLRFNGTNQWLQTNSIDFTYGDKMFVCAGVRKLSDAARGVLAELSTDLGTNNGTFLFDAPAVNGSPNARFGSKGTVFSQAAIETVLIAPTTIVLSGIGNIGGKVVNLRANSSTAVTSTSDQGTGNYGNYPLYIGARAGTSLWFNGRLHQLIVAGKQASASEIGQTEAFTNQKTGAY